MDVWGDDDDDDSGGERQTAARDTRNLRQKHYNEGYKESLSSSREAALQGGFEAGFQEGYAQGLKAGLIIGICSSAIDLAPNLDLTSQLPEIRQILADAKSLDTTSARKSVEFSDKVLRAEAALASALNSDLRTELHSCGPIP